MNGAHFQIDACSRTQDVRLMNCDALNRNAALAPRWVKSGFAPSLALIIMGTVVSTTLMSIEEPEPDPGPLR
jgi:hypothetical protein